MSFAPAVKDLDIGIPGTVLPTPGRGLTLNPKGEVPTRAPVTAMRMLTADPGSPLVGEFWYRTDTNQLSIKTASGVKRVTLA